MHRTQRQQYQIRPDFDEHFRKVWTGDLNDKVKLCFILFIRRIVKPASLS